MLTEGRQHKAPVGGRDTGTDPTVRAMRVPVVDRRRSRQRVHRLEKSRRHPRVRIETVSEVSGGLAARYELYSVPAMKL